MIEPVLLAADQRRMIINHCFWSADPATEHALTVGDVVTLLNVSERQVYKLAAEHRVPCFRIGAYGEPPGNRRP
jgi:hypothetical protein